MTNLERVAEVIAESHEEGHLPSQSAVSTLQDIVFFLKIRIQNETELLQKNEESKAIKSVGHKTEDIPRREEGGIPCRRARRQRMTAQRRNCPTTCAPTTSAMIQQLRNTEDTEIYRNKTRIPKKLPIHSS
jgi:hypothetical protein